MKDSKYGILCAFLFGLGQLCMFTGYDSQSFVVESVLHSVHDRYPDRIDGHAGYYGQAVMNAFYTLANIFAPCLLAYMSSKLVLVLGSAMFTMYMLGFFVMNSYFFYISCAFLGVGFALFYTGNGGYLTEHSTRETIERNSAITWAVGTTCMIVGGIVMLFTSKAGQNQQTAGINAINTTRISNHTLDTHSYRTYSDTEIHYLFGAFAFISFLSNLIFAFIPGRHVADSLADLNNKNRPSFKGQMVSMWEALLHPRMLLLAPLFSLVGLTTSFWISVYPTTLQFTKSLSGFVYLPALYSIVVGTGDMLMCALISILAKPIPNFGQKPTMALGLILCLTTYALILATTPPLSSTTPNDDPPLLVQPTVLSCLVIAFLFGLSDGCLNTARTIMCAIALPKKRNQTFAISKLYQSLAGMCLFFASPYLSVYFYLVLLSITSIISAITFFVVVNLTHDMEQKLRTDKNLGPDDIIPTDNSTKIPYQKNPLEL